MMATSDDRIRNKKLVSRWQFFPLVGATTALATVAAGSLAVEPSGQPEKRAGAKARFVYVGTYTAPGVPPGGTHTSTAVGIYVFRMNPADGGLTPIQLIAAPNPSYLALDPTLHHLYSVNEMTEGHVSAYAINQSNGMLSFLNSQSANGRDTTHLSVQPSGKYLFAANYTSGNFPVFPILADGWIDNMTDEFQSEGNGTGPNPARQEGPHAHQILTDLDGNTAIMYLVSISARIRSMS
jgi:6-phosphogluconolactonase